MERVETELEDVEWRTDGGEVDVVGDEKKAAGSYGTESLRRE